MKAGPPRVVAAILVLCLSKWALVDHHPSDVWSNLPGSPSCAPQLRMRRMRRQPGATLALLLSAIKGRRAVTLAHTKAAARTFMSSFIRPPEQKVRGGGGGV